MVTLGQQHGPDEQVGALFQVSYRRQSRFEAALFGSTGPALYASRQGLGGQEHIAAAPTLDTPTGRPRPKMACDAFCCFRDAQERAGAPEAAQRGFRSQQTRLSEA